MKRTPLLKYQPRRIAILKPSALGDIVHALPVLTALRQRFPAAHISWIVNRAYEPLLAGHPDLDATLPFHRNAGGAGLWPMLAETQQLLRRLRGQRFDLVLDLQNLLRTGLMAWLSGAPRRIGLATAREGARWFYTDLVGAPGIADLHAVERYWLAVEALGAGDQPRQFRVPLVEAECLWAREQLQDLPRPWLVVGVGARWQTKRWLPQHFATLVDRALRRFGGTAIFVGSRDEDATANWVASRLRGRSLLLTGKTSLPQLTAILSLADAMLANDTGPLHLAAALGRPVIAPYTCTKVRWTGPYGQTGHAVETRVWCQGSCLKTCARMECMPELTPERLWPVLEEVLQQWQSHRLTA